MESASTSKDYDNDWSFLNISDVDPKQLYHKVETTINGVTKKILVPVMKSQLQQKVPSPIPSSPAHSSPSVKSLLESEPITIVPLEDSELDCNPTESGLQISNVTSLKPFLEKPASNAKQQVRNMAMPVAKGRGRGRGRKPKNVRKEQNGQPTRTRSCKTGTVSIENNDNSSLNDPTVLKDIIFALMSERIGLQKDVISTTGKQNTSNIILEHPELPAHQGKMLIHVGQNPDGSHMYKTYDIATNKDGQQSVSRNTHVAARVMSSEPVYSTASLPIQNSPSLTTAQQVQPLRSTIVATPINLPDSVRQYGNVPPTTGTNVLMMENGLLQRNQKDDISQSVLSGDTSSRPLNAVSCGVNAQANTFMSALPAGTQVIPVTKQQVIAGSGFSQFSLFPPAGQVNTGPQTSFQTLSPASPQMHSQTAQSKSIAPQNIINSAGLSTKKGNAVLIGPVALGNNQLIGSPLQVISPARTDAHSISSQIPARSLSVVLSKNSLCNTSASSCTISNKSTTGCQQPAVLTGYLNKNGQIVIQSPAALPENQHSQPVAVKTAALLTSPNTQTNSITVSVAAHSLPVANCNGVAPGKPSQLIQPFFLQNSPALPNSGVQPTGIINLGVPVTNQNSISVKQNNVNTPLILQGGNVVTNQVIQPTGAQTENNVLNSIYNSASVSLVASCSTTVVSSQTGNPVAANAETASIFPRFGQFQVNAKEAATLRIEDLDVATLLNIARCGGVKDVIQLQNCVLQSKNAAFEKKRSPGREILGDKLTRRQVDINVGRERTIYPKTSEVLPVSKNPGHIVPIYNNGSENGTISQSLPDIPATRPDMNAVDENVSEDQTCSSYCSIVNLIKQDLALIDKHECSKSSLVSKQNSIKPCKIILEKLNIGSHTTVNLKRCKLLTETSSRRTKKIKKRKPNVKNKRHSVTRKRRSRRIN